MELEELRRIEGVTARVFEREYKAALAYAAAKLSDPRKATTVARKIAKRHTSRWLVKRYGMTLDELQAKIMAAELDFSLEDVATG